jgi:hypothetical protein
MHKNKDIEDVGFICKNIPFEVGSTGHITGSNRANLATLHKIAKPKTNPKTFLQIISRIRILCSYSIYLSRNEKRWSDPPPFVYTNN